MDGNKWCSFGQRTYSIIYKKKLRNNNNNLNNDLHNLIKRMSQAAYVNFRLKTMITFLWNVLYMIILEEIYFLLYEFMAKYIWILFEIE